MKVQVSARHVELTDDVRDYVEMKANKLPRFYDRIHEIEVVLGHEWEQFTVEMIVRVDDKHTFVAKELGPDTFGLVDVITEKLERQLKKYKEKKRDHKQDGKAGTGGDTAVP